MASCSKGANGEECESSTVPNWLELPRDITVNILQRLDTIDIVTSACLVCPIWWNICKDPLMWRTIHMTASNSSRWDYPDLVKICRYAIERSCGHLEEIDIKHFATNKLLKFIADNASNLRCMRILNGWLILEIVFNDAVRKLSQLEEVEISMCIFSKDSLGILGQSCPLLKVLKFERAAEFSYIRGAKDDDDAYIISETMPRLHHLEIKGNTLTNIGLLAILDGCPLLESLYMEGCRNLCLSEGLRERCLEQIKDLRLPVKNNYEDYEYSEYLEDFYYEYFDPYD